MNELPRYMPPYASRPESGFAAWQIMLHHISRHVSPDARLILEIHPKEGHILYGARLKWGTNAEEVRGAGSLADSMRRLWVLVDHYHKPFTDPAVPDPSDYDLVTWFDKRTYDILQRLIQTTHSILTRQWRIVAIYRPGEIPDLRVQMRLTAPHNMIQVGGRGPSIGEAARHLFNNAAPALAQYAQRSNENAGGQYVKYTGDG